ncbi:hypothetical protein L345_17022, partial [Ophiophagus hannah]
MENDLLRKLRQNMKRLQKEVSRSRENIRMHLGQDLSLKMRSHQAIVERCHNIKDDPNG